MDSCARIVKFIVPPITSDPPGTPGKFEERIMVSNGPFPILKGRVAEVGVVSTNAPAASALASPTISADTGVVALSPVTPRAKVSAAPLQVTSELQVMVPETLASEPVKPVVRVLMLKGDAGVAAAVKEEIEAAEAVMVPSRMQAKTAAALAHV
jgi:hypothetical protein